ncbi:DUF262 domain-containing protein [Spiroplasma apis]|uniref:GmrSD restriction endonucleases N-terminal domain-containing protein n=1 Tax=Spiroplasma apis B31 TaxID=1276258 RepID=V5RKK0_SPIAP|nr:DUF262 domain-containing protein [Spiroplasma apis]AHB36340.1 hypothetical protein SAPIS_v1c04950 [Spiroplasma apis B31]
MIAEKINFTQLIGIDEKNNIKEEFDYIFIIPEFQRGYVWNKGQLDELLEDLYKAYKNKDKKGFSSLGVFYFYQSYESNKLEIIDGQQRFTTFLIILEAIKSLIRKDLHRHSLFDRSIQRIITSYSEVSHLELSYKQFFDNHLYEKSNVDENYMNNDSTFKELSANYLEAKKWINNKFENLEDKNLFYNFLLNDIYFWPYLENDEEVKIDLFMKLNSRGRQLAFSTLLKSFLFSIDNLELQDEYSGNKKALTIAKYYEEQIEEPLFKEFLSDIKSTDTRYKHIMNAASCFFFIEARNYLDSYKNLEDVIGKEKELFVGYVKLFTKIFEIVKVERNSDKNVLLLKKIMSDMKTYMIKYITLSVLHQNQLVKKLVDIEIVKYNSLISWIEIKRGKKLFIEESIIELYDLLFIYLYSRRLKWFVDNKFELEHGKKTEQLNPRNLSFYIFFQTLIKDSSNLTESRSFLKSLLDEELLSKANEFENGNFEIWKNAKSYQKVIQYLDEYLKLRKKYNI